MQRIRQGALYSLRGFGLVLFIAAALMTAEQCSTPAFAQQVAAQQGVVPTPEPTTEEQLSRDGPIQMGVIWDYIEYAFGDPLVAAGVLIFEAGIPDEGGIFHIQVLDGAGNNWHVDVELSEMSPGGAISDDGSFQFIWFCYNEDIEDPLGGCTLPLASWVIGYDTAARTALRWPERIQ